MESLEVPSSPDNGNKIEHVKQTHPRSRVLAFMKTKKFAVFVALAAFSGDTERVYQQKIPPPPVITSNSGTPVSHEKPSPNMDIETLMQSIETVEDLQEFLKHRSEHENPYPWDFFRTFRQPPGKIQEKQSARPWQCLHKLHRPLQ
jgi:hypothetical protein